MTGRDDAGDVFPTLADGLSAQAAVNTEKKVRRGERLRRRGIVLAAAFLLISIVAVFLNARFESNAVTIVWAGSVMLIFLLAARLWQSLLKEDEKKDKRIRDRDQRYRQTLALLPEGVTILGENWRLEWVNKSAMEHFGLRPESIGASFFDAVTDEDFRRWLLARNYSRHYALQDNAGRELEVAVVAPDLRHMMIVTHDVTERRRVDDMRRDFVANVSHELRTPLTVISGFLNMEVDAGKIPPEMLERHRQLMLEQATRMRSLLDDLLLLSSLENKDESDDADAEVIAMPKLLEDVVMEGKALSLGRHHITLETEDISLIGDADEIRSAAMNLVSNAVRYTPDGGTIAVSWKRSGMGAALSVKDTGIGIEAKHIPRLTERFYRVDKGRSRDTGGTGLGLAIVKHVLRRNGGELRIESTPGKGSTFTMVFPESRIFSEDF